jgi:hypothetical protein
MLTLGVDGMLLGMLLECYVPTRTVTVVLKEHDVHNIHAHSLGFLTLRNLELVQQQRADALLVLKEVLLLQDLIA